MNKFSDQKKASSGTIKDDHSHKNQTNAASTPSSVLADKATGKPIANEVHPDKADKTVPVKAVVAAKGDIKPAALKTKWKSKVNAAKDNWGKLSSSELLKSDGDAKVLAELVHLRYSISMVDANKQVKQFLDKCHC